MTISISVQMEPEHSAARIIHKFQRFEVDVKDASEAWPKLTRDFCRREEIHFKEGQSGGWEPLSPKYAAWKSRHAPGMPILELGVEDDSEHLKDSLTNPGRAVLDFGPMHLELGTDVRYAKYHQDGFSTRGGSKEVVIRKGSTRLVRKGDRDFSAEHRKRIIEEFQRLLSKDRHREPNREHLLREAANVVMAGIREHGGIKLHTPAITEMHRSTGRGRGPARPPLIAKTPAVRDAWRRIMVKWLHDELNDAGF